MSSANPEPPTDANLEQRRLQIRRRLTRANTAAVVILILVIGLSLGAVLQAFRAERNAHEAERSRRAAESELERTRLAEARALTEQARAQRRTGEAGQRFDSLAAVAKAAALQPSPALRDEAIAALALPDLRFVPVWTNATASFRLFSPSLRQLAAGVAQGEIKLLNGQAAKEEGSLPAIGAPVNQFWFSPNERFLGVYYWNGSNVVWDLETKTPVRAWGPDYRFLEFCPESDRAILAEDSGVLRCLNLGDGQELWHCQRPDVSRLSAASHGPCFALFSQGDPASVQVRNLQTGELVRELAGNAAVETVGWSSDGKQLVVGRENGWIEVWNAETWTKSKSWRAHDDAVVEIRFDPAGRWLASASWDLTIRFWSLPDFQLVMRATGYEGHFCGQFSRDGARFVCALSRHILGFLETTPSPVLKRFFVPPGDSRGAWSLDVSPDGKLVAGGYTEGVQVLDLITGHQVAFEPVFDCRSVLFTPEGAGLITCGWTNLAYWPIQPLHDATNPPIRLGPPQTLQDELPLGYAALTSDGRWAAVAKRDNERAPGCVAVYELRNPTNNFPLTFHPRIQHVAVSPNGQWVASGTWNGRGVKVWEFATRRQVAELPINTSANVTFSPDSHLLVTSSREYRVWECGSWRELYRGPESGGPVGTAAFSPDGRLLAVSKALYSVGLLEPATGKLLAALEAPGAPLISALRFTPDSKKLLALDWTRPILVWDLPRIHEELAKLGLDWDKSLPGSTQPGQITLRADSRLAVTGTVVSPDKRKGAANWWQSLFASRRGIWLYALPLTALVIGIAIAIYTLGYHQRMMRSYEEVESIASERNRALDAARTELLHSQKMRALGTLAAGIAHDFNNLLSVIRMGNNLLQRREVSTQEKAQSSQAVERAVEQGKKIVRSMLGYSREQAEETESYSVPDLVNEAGLLLNQQFLSGITLTLELGRDIPPVVGRRGRLQQILLNLIVNAAEAMNGQGRLRIAARATESVGDDLVLQPGPAERYLELVVEDTGTGIDPQIRERVFEPFFSTKPRGASSGTGLGLSLVHSLAEQEKMGISLKSQPGQGTTFTLWIPVAEVPCERAREPALT